MEILITCSETRKMINSASHKEELPHMRDDSLNIPICNKGNETDRNKHRGTSKSLNTYKSVSHIFLSRFSSYAEETVADNQCGFLRSRSTIDYVFCTRQILEKIWNKVGQCISYQSLLFSCEGGFV